MTEEQKPTSEKSVKRKSNTYWEWGKAIIIAVALALLIRHFLFEPYLVEGSSMYPTLHDGERLFVNKSVNYIGEIERGDIVIINGDTSKVHYVKRLIGKPGETVEMKNDTLYINGKKIAEPYLASNKKEAKKLGVNLTGDLARKGSERQILRHGRQSAEFNGQPERTRFNCRKPDRRHLEVCVLPVS